MASLKDLRNRIGSVKSTQKITKAMKMVAASKLRKAQDAAEAARPYADRMSAVISALATGLPPESSAPPLLADSGSGQTHLLVVATSERGLCGGFNVNIVRGARAHMEALEAEGKTVKLLCIGRKGFGLLQREFADKIVDLVDFTGIKTIGFAEAQPIGQKIVEMFEAGEFDVCTLFYAKFVSALTQDVTPLQLIPAAVDEDAVDEEAGGYDYEPDEEQILATLLPRNISVQVFRGLLENAASEQGARMTAMDNATRNAGDMIDRLTLTYNRTRQAEITKELIEIISGAEAL